MPGNVKLGSSNEPDPDPLPYLAVSMDMKRQDMLKPYDPKKSYWVPDDQGGFLEGLLQSDDGKKAVVMIGHEKKTFKSELIAQVNPPKFEKCEDMSNLTYLNEASVLWNLKSRYQSKLIYTYSGLFCVAVNPYKRFPIYTPTAVKLYLGKRRNEVPPHLFAISDTAYRNMLSKSQCQSILVTGESGAGKTENTKKVISYFAMVGAREEKKRKSKKASLEDQIVQTNPILESFGNAKTARNDNSSRFGKFIRIHFNASGKLAGCDIETYLLEKSRITFQQEVERSYHIFYQMMQKLDSGPDIKKLCHLSDDIYDYHYVSQGKTSVPSIDDKEDLEFTHDAFNILHFTEEETINIYKAVAAVMHMGEVKFKQKGREEQCEPDSPEQAKKVADLLGIDPEAMMKAYCKPKIKVGTEWVTKGQNIDQSTQAVAGIARGLYDRIFRFLVEKCNETLVDPTMKKVVFIGVLDIAGFEIFKFNGFEQLCINFCNEKLQQFFNHHMFVLEQEEYIREGIDWQMVDFGMDLQSCITMFEKPMGILAILEEESLFPKATDKTFEEKLKSNHLGKSPNFAKASTKSDKNANFAVVHYAGTVSYNVTGWLEKNKDPLNDTMVELVKNGSNNLIIHVFADHPGQSPLPEDKTKKGKKAKGSGSKTVSSFYKSQLDSLMSTLHATEPHFIRCIVPNGNKMPGEIDSGLVLHQLTCNGVLEGIRICMRGFPNRMPYPEFCTRYAILNANKISQMSNKDPKKITDTICNDFIDKERFRVGHTKVFFRAGVLGYLEEVRDDIVLKLVRFLQGACYGFLRRKDFEKKRQQRELIRVIQRNFRQFLSLRNWGWFSIIQKTKPLIGMINIEEEIKFLEDAASKATSAVESEENERKRLEEENKRLQEDTLAMMKRIEAEQGDLVQYQERSAKAATQKACLELELNDNQEKLDNESRRKDELHDQKRALESEVGNIRKDFIDMEEQLAKAETEKTTRDHKMRNLNDDIANLDEVISKLNKEKKYVQENNSKANEDLHSAEDKVNHLNMVKAKLEQTMDDLEDTLERERRAKNDIEKQRRKVEGDLKVQQEMVMDMEKGKRELEGVVQRRERDIAEMNARLEGEQAGYAKQQRHVKETQARVEELEEELEAERQARAKAERQKQDLGRELEELSERLDEASGATTAQMELNKKREMEVQRLRKDLEEATIQQESIILSLKKKHQDAIGEMSEQMDQLGKLKVKVEHDKTIIQRETEELRVTMDELVRSKASAEKANKGLQAQFGELNKRLAEGNLQLSDMDNGNKKSMAENGEILRQLEEVESNISMLNKTKIQLTNSLEDAKRSADDEAKERQSLLGRYRNLEHEFDGMNAIYEEELASKEDLARQAKKAELEANQWRQKYELEGIAKIEELENSKLKLQARLTECEGTVENLNSKLIQLDKTKTHLQQEIDNMTNHVDNANMQYSQMEKKIRQFDKIIGDWKHKADGLADELDQSQKECRNVATELFRVKNGYEDASNQLNEVRRENQTLTDEIKDLMEQISEGGRSIHEIEKQRKRLETEKKELQGALEEAEAALEQEENKFLRAQVELSQARQEIERRLAEKEEEFDAARRSHQKGIEMMQSNLEAEMKAKAEAQRMKKKLEADVLELDSALEHAHATHQENQRTIDKYQNSIRESQIRFDDEQKVKAIARENMLNAERRAHTLQNALEEIRTLLEQADRARRAAEQELSECNETMSDLSVQNQSLAANKRRLEGEMDNLRQDLDDMKMETMMTEDKARKAMMDAARISEELRMEQDLTHRLENERKMLDAQVKDLQIRLDDAEMNAMKNGRKAAQKMESRIKELESELDSEQRRLGDSMKNLKKNERKIKEMDFQEAEDRKQHEHMQDLVEKLQMKLRNYKKQIEEAEEIAAMNLAKFRKTQVETEESEERADLSEQALSKYRVMGRSNTPNPGQLGLL